MADEPEEGFTIRDRRRFTSEATETPVSAVAPPVASPVLPPATDSDSVSAFVDESAEGEEGEGENALPDIFSVLILFLGEMRSHALLRMGLVANPMTGQSERDLQQAKVAIDTAAFLATQLEAVLPPEERLPLRAMISDLQMAFVDQTRRG